MHKCFWLIGDRVFILGSAKPFGAAKAPFRDHTNVGVIYNLACFRNFPLSRELRGPIATYRSCPFDSDLNDYVARDYFQEFERQNITDADYRVVFICGIPEVYLNARGFLKLLVNSPSPVAKYRETSQ